MNTNLEAFAFCPELTSIYGQTKLRTASGKEFDVGTCSTINNLVILKNLFVQLKPKRTLEVGMAFGGSCLLFAGMFRKTGTVAAKQHIAIDPFQSSYWEKLGIHAIERAGLSGYVDVREEFSSLELPRLVTQREEIDLVYVDGSHLFEDVFVDAYFTLRLLSAGGVVAFDDCRYNHVNKVVRFIRRNMTSSLEEMDLSSFRADQGKSARYRLAKLFGQTQMTAFRRVGDSIRRPWNAPFHNF